MTASFPTNGKKIFIAICVGIRWLIAHLSKMWNFSTHFLPHRCAAVTHAHCCGTFFHFFVESLVPHNCGKGFHLDVEPNSTLMFSAFPQLLLNCIAHVLWKLFKYYSSGFCSVPHVSCTNRESKINMTQEHHW